MRTRVILPAGHTSYHEYPWEPFVAGLRTWGIQVVDDEADALVTFNHQPEVIKRADYERIPVSRRVLIALEPASTLPSMYRPETQQSYGLKLAPSPIWSGLMGAESFLWPQRLPRVTQTVQPLKSFTHSATMIAGDKRSSSSSSLYGLRRDVLRRAANDGVTVALAGPGWDRRLPSRLRQATRELGRWVAQSRQWPNLHETYSGLSRPRVDYFGVVQDKGEFLRLAPVTIVIENSPDYVSEKLIDAVASGACPVYVGPPLSLFDLPEDLCIPVEPSATSVLDGVRQAHRDYERVVDRGRTWILHEAIEHDYVTVMTNLAAGVCRYLHADAPYSRMSKADEGEAQW